MKRIAEEIERAAVEAYATGKSSSAVATEFGVGRRFVLEAVRRAGGEVRPTGRPSTGDRKRERGYVRVTVPADHPQAHLAGTTRQAMEHRLVMAAHLGRPLEDFENVHHINGVRDDNRIENLELWVTSQPSGQRPEDLLAWAHQIIKMYPHWPHPCWAVHPFWPDACCGLPNLSAVA